MITENKILQKSLLVLLILILPASIYTFTTVTAQSLPQAFAINTQGGTAGAATSNSGGEICKRSEHGGGEAGVVAAGRSHSGGKAVPPQRGVAQAVAIKRAATRGKRPEQKADKAKAERIVSVPSDFVYAPQVEVPRQLAAR